MQESNRQGEAAAWRAISREKVVKQAGMLLLGRGDVFIRVGGEMTVTRCPLEENSDWSHESRYRDEQRLNR